MVLLITIAIAIPTASHLLSEDPTIPTGEAVPGSILDLHKSLIDRLSLLSFSESSGGGEDSASSTWILIILLIGVAVVSTLRYLYHRKIKLPRKRAQRESEREERARNERNQAFLESPMARAGTNPTPA